MPSLPGPDELDCLSTDRLRNAFLVQHLFEPGRMNLVYTGLDRIVIGGVVPVREMVLSAFSELGTTSFAERRELGIMNLGATGVVAVSGRRYTLETLDCLYIGKGEDTIVFEASAGAVPPKYYLCSTPAHKECPTVLVGSGDAETIALGNGGNASKRRIVKYIFPGKVESCQLVMGYTELDDNSVWNTMPPHTHSRRSEVYLYCDMGDALVFHLMGRPERTRHLVVRNGEAVLSPAWSMHAGAGTSRYRFVWAMAGENQDFGDIDPIDMSSLR